MSFEPRTGKAATATSDVVAWGFDMAATIDDRSLEGVEDALLDGFRARTTDGVDVIGFGETGVALSWPAGDGRLVLKRVTSFADQTEADEVASDLQRYIDAIAPHVTVVDTEIRTVVNRDGRVPLYLVQPRLAGESLVETIMDVDRPREGHPAVEAVVDVALRASASGRLGVDAQFQNFAWRDGELVLFDVGTPMMFEPDGSYAFDTTAVRRVMPAFARGAAEKKFAEIVCDIGSRQGSLEQAAMSLVRVGQQRWLPVVLDLVNPHLDRPLDTEAVLERAQHLHRQSGTLKRLMRLERWWSTQVRRRPYDMFITDSFSGEIL
ncbi:MAG: DUF6206 family protein [Actinomycetota bacterium]